MSSKGHTPIWNITSASSSMSLFWMSRIQKMRHFDTLKYRFMDTTKVAF
jgi:hypothetical protein